MTLGSPAVAYGGRHPGRLAGPVHDRGGEARATGSTSSRCTGTAATSRTANAVDQLKSYLQAVYNRYHKPIWLTEFALIDFSNGTRLPTQAQQAAFVTASTTMLDGLS